MKLPAWISGPDRSVAVVLGSSALLLAVYVNYGMVDFAESALGVPRGDPAAVWWQYLAAFLLLGVTPVGIWRLALKRPFAEVGLTIGDWRFGLRFLAVTIPLLVIPLVWIGVRMPDVQAEYPMARTPAGEPLGLFWLEVAYLLFYLGWEIFYRGWLILGVRERTGDAAAIGFSTLITVAAHIGKPEGEVWGAVLVGIVFGWLVIRTRSILWPLVIHAATGLLTDFLILYGPGSAP